MPTIVGILTFINRIKARKIYIFHHFIFNFNISEKSSNEQKKCDPSYTDDKNEWDKGELSDSEKRKSELSDSEKRKSETSDSGASYRLQTLGLHMSMMGHFSKWRKLIMRLDFSLILKVKHEYFCPGPGL